MSYVINLIYSKASSTYLIQSPTTSGKVCSLIRLYRDELVADSVVTPLVPNCSQEAFTFTETLQWDSDDSSSEDSQSAHILEPNISRLLGHIFENIKTLCLLGNVLRQTRVEGCYLHSSGSNDLDSFHQHDYRLVREKLSQWKNQQVLVKPSSPAVPKAEETAIMTRIKDEKQVSIEPDSILTRRIATANMKRRQQIRYWKAYPSTLGDQAPSPSIEIVQPGTPDQPKPSRHGNVAEDDLSEYRPIDYPPTARGFSTEASSTIEINLTHEGILRIVHYVPPIIKSYNSLRDSDGLGPRSVFKCPICHMEIRQDDANIE